MQYQQPAGKLVVIPLQQPIHAIIN